MNKLCSCGGKLWTLNQNKFYFRKICDKCRRIYKQRKRQAEPTKKEIRNRLINDFRKLGVPVKVAIEKIDLLLGIK